MSFRKNSVSLPTDSAASQSKDILKCEAPCFILTKREPEKLLAINSEKKLIADSKMSLAQAYKYLGQCYWEGGGVKDKNQARKYFRKSKEYGYDIDEEYL